MDQLDQLVSLITASVADLKAEYNNSGQTLPNLDDLDPHPFDTQQPSPQLKKAIQVIQGACAQLSTLVVSPQQALCVLGWELFHAACLRVAIQGKISDHLKGHPEGLHASELASRSGLEVGKLSRILRLLASKHCFREIAKNVFANNRLSILLSTDPALCAWIDLLGDEYTKCAGVLHETLADSESSHSYAPNKTPWNRAMGYEGPMWQYYMNVNPEKGSRFESAMTGFGKVINYDSILRGYPWKDLPEGTSVCDLGGGIGSISLQLAASFPHLHFVLQDLEPTINRAKNVWQERAPQAVKAKRIDFIPIDFLMGPPVLGCDFYYMKHIIHAFTDEDCITILSNVRKAMKSQSRLLIQEYVLQHVDPNIEEHHPVPRAPEPLLPNYGSGRMMQYYLDLNLMSAVNARERTLGEFLEIAKRGGFELFKVWDCGELSALEFQLKSL